MDERETALFVLNSKGYLSKTMLSRRLKCSLSEAAKKIESLLPLEGVFALYSRFFGNKVEIFNEKVNGSVLYALSKVKDKNEMYRKELEDKEEFHVTGEIVYPPADSGVYLQQKRKIFTGSAFNSSTVKQETICPRPLVVRNLEEGLEMKIFEKCENEKCEKNEKNEEMEKGTLEVNNRVKIVEKESNCKKVRFGENNENTPAHEIKIRRKGTPFPDGKHFKSVKNKEDEKVKDLKKNKKDKGIQDFYVPTIPVVLRRKVMKTRNFVEGGKIMTEDYSSEEEIVINRTPMPIPKKSTSQTKLTFK